MNVTVILLILGDPYHPLIRYPSLQGPEEPHTSFPYAQEVQHQHPHYHFPPLSGDLPAPLLPAERPYPGEWEFPIVSLLKSPMLLLERQQGGSVAPARGLLHIACGYISRQDLSPGPFRAWVRPLGFAPGCDNSYDGLSLAAPPEESTEHSLHLTTPDGKEGLCIWASRMTDVRATQPHTDHAFSLEVDLREIQDGPPAQTWQIQGSLLATATLTRELFRISRTRATSKCACGRTPSWRGILPAPLENHSRLLRSAGYTGYTSSRPVPH
jgi:hypothetical protein